MTMEHVHQGMPATRVKRRITRLYVFEHRKGDSTKPNLYLAWNVFCGLQHTASSSSLPSILPQLAGFAASPGDELQESDIQHYYKRITKKGQQWGHHIIN